MRLVIKTGSATLSNTHGGLNPSAVSRIAKQLAFAHKADHEVIARGQQFLVKSQRPDGSAGLRT